jgi:hypothetical protein
VVGEDVPAMCRVCQSASGATTTLGRWSLLPPPCAAALSAQLASTSTSALKGVVGNRVMRVVCVCDGEV